MTAPLPEPIRFLVVDDEMPARNRLIELLDKDSSAGEIFEAKDAVDAVALIQSERPDVVFLDVQMPGADGFSVIDALGRGNMPTTVFVTGYDDFALQAFEADAVDYLLKPFEDARFEETMERVKRRLNEVSGPSDDAGLSFGPGLQKLAAKRSRPDAMWQWIVVKSRDCRRLVITEEIDWIEAAGVYVTLHVGEHEYLYRGGLTEVASHLDPSQFVQVHRSNVVNLRSVALLERRSHSEFEILLKTGKRLVLSRNFRAHVEAMLGQSL
jgi:two-component system, LytTR family, response regulator